jgi:hypothetical protein
MSEPTMPIDEIRSARSVSRRHRLRRALLPTLTIVVVIAAGCSTTDPGPQEPTSDTTSAAAAPTSRSAGPAAPSGRTATRGSSTPSARATAEGEDPTPVECAVTGDEISLFRRNWDRVVGSVGREDHPTYTTPFVSEVDALAEKAKDCPGASNFGAMKTALADIEQAAEDGNPDYEAINAFVKAGNAWLESLGYGSGVLATS